MSEIKVNSIKGVGATAAAITVNNSDGTCTANITNKPNRNLIINGAMQVAQRGTSSTTTNAFTIDRFSFEFNGVGVTVTNSQQSLSSSDTPFTKGFRKFNRIALASAGTAGAGNYILFEHRLEAQDVANSGWNYTDANSFITVSFWARASTSQTYGISFESEDGTAQLYPKTFSLTANTWTKITQSIPGNSNLQFDDNNNIGARFKIYPYLGTTYSGGTDNTWAARSALGYGSMGNQSAWLTAGASTFDITGVQLEVGSVATDFEHRSFAVEKRLCMRYYQQYVNIMMAGFVPDNSSRVYGLGLNFPVEMRSAPSITLTATGSSSGQTISDGSANAYVTSLLSSGATSQHVELSLNVNTDLTDFRVAVAYGSGYSVRETTYKFSSEI